MPWCWNSFPAWCEASALCHCSLLCSSKLCGLLDSRFRGNDGSAFVAPALLRQRRIKRLRGLAEDPILVGRLGEGERLARGAENLGQRADRIRKIRAPGEPGSAERIDDLAEERIRRALAPA